MVFVDIWQRGQGSPRGTSFDAFLSPRPGAEDRPPGTPLPPLPNVDKHHSGVSCWTPPVDATFDPPSPPVGRRRRQALTPALTAVRGTLRTPVYNQLPNRRERSDPRTGPGDSDAHPSRTRVR